MSIVDKRFSVAQQILDTLEEDLLPRDYTRESTVFVGFVGSINAGVLRWAAAKRGIPVKFRDFDRNEDISKYQQAIMGSDYVITAAEKTPELSTYLPTVAHHIRIHEWVSGHPGWEKLNAYPTYGEGGFHLFRKTTAVPVD